MIETKKELRGKLTEEQLKKLKKEIVEAMANNRHQLLCEIMPFIGNIAMRFNLIPVRDRRCRTACMDYRNIYFDCDFYLSLSQSERIFVFAHEVWHAVQLHAQRCQTRNHDLWNIAADMEINNILSTHESRNILTPPSGLMFPPTSLRGQSAETLYDWLIKQQSKNNLNNALSQMGRPDSEDSDSERSSNGDGKRHKRDGGDKFNGTEKRDSSKDGKNTGKLEGQFDRHEYENGPDDAENSEVRDQWGEVGYDDDFRPSISQDAAERMREAVISSAQQYQREHGTLPAGVEGLLDKLVRPEISWKEMLAQFVTQCYGCRRSWLPPQRRHVWHDGYFQSRRNEKIRGVIAIDTSGSCVGELPKFFGELKGLIDSFGGYELTVICADAAVDQVDTYEDGNNPLEINTASDVKWSGGGGTDYSKVFEYIDENNLNPDFLCYLGDGYAAMDYKGPPQYPVLWLITKDGTFDFCDWGKKIKFKESSWE